jgi:epoxyqueuosine reductase
MRLEAIIAAGQRPARRGAPPAMRKVIGRKRVAPRVITKLTEIWPVVERWAEEEGVLRVGGSELEDRNADLFRSWIEAGREAEMHYLRKNVETRIDPRQRFPWARSVIVFTIPYEPDRPRDDSIASRIARYAQGEDYHFVLDRMLRRLEERLSELSPDIVTRRYVDTGPLSDRALATQAGLGWIAKNAMLIDEKHGSWTLIGTLLTSLEHDLEPVAVTDRCGSCTRCIDACPTDAILPDRTVDSHRCISYLTIEHRGPLSGEWRDSLEGNLFGCDICQEVCPWNRGAPPGHEALAPREEYRNRPIHDLLGADQEQFSTLFRKSAVKRAKRAGILRNLLLIDPSISGEDLEDEEDPGIRDALRSRADSPIR